MEPPWLQLAKSMPIGAKRKIKCCSQSASMIVSHTLQGYRAHCFRDSAHSGFVPKGLLSTKEVQSILSATSELRHSKAPSLSGCSSIDKTHTKALKWLLSAGISFRLISSYGLMWHAATCRVVLPIHDHADELIATVSRDVSGLKGVPKYLERTKDNRTDVVFKADPSLALRDSLYSANGRTVCITEDILSAIRVGRLAHACALLGTTCSAGQALALIKDGYTSVYLWLDGDKAGRVGSLRIKRTLSLAGLDVQVIRTPKDPKLYSDRFIKETLLNAGYCSSAPHEGPEDIQSTVPDRTSGR